MHYLTLPELIRLLEAEGHTEMASVLQQVADRKQVAIRVDLEKLLRKPDASAGSLPQR